MVNTAISKIEDGDSNSSTRTKKKYIWIDTKRPHRYFPHIMVNHCELVEVNEEENTNG